MTTENEQQAGRRILITGGRAPVALEWCRLLHAAGHTIYVAESFPTPLCRYSNTVSHTYTVPAPRQQPVAFIKALGQIIEQAHIDLLLPTCEEIFHIAGGLERLPQHVRVVAPTLAQLHRLHHKGDFIELVRAADLAVPETVVLANAQQWVHTQQHARESGMAMVLKPVYSRFASQVWLPPQEGNKAWQPEGTVVSKRSGTSDAGGKAGQGQAAEMERAAERVPAVGNGGAGVRSTMKPEILAASTPAPTATPAPAPTPTPTPTPTPSVATPCLRAGTCAELNSLTAPVPETLSPQQPWIAQRFIAGEQLCTYSIVHEGVVVAHATYRCRYRNSRAGASVHFEALERKDTLEWVQALVSGWQEIQAPLHADEQVAAIRSITSLHNDEGHPSPAKPSFARFSGQLSFDLIEQQQTGKLYPLECNPRATSGVHLFRPEDGLERALLDPARLVDNGTIVQPLPGTRVMLTLPMLASGIGRHWSRAQWLQWWQAFRGARDAVYRHYDPLPAYGQLHLLWRVWRISRQERISIVEALTYDIEWNG